MTKRLIKCILLVSLFPSYFCGHVFSAKSVREVSLHKRTVNAIPLLRNRKLGKNVGKRVRGVRSGFPMIAPEEVCSPKNKDFGVEEFLKKYWPYGLPVLGVPPLGLLTYKLINRSDTQSSVPGCLLSRNEFTPKQEGAWWCWLACLCGLLKAQNVRTPEGNEITQEWMYEKIFKQKPAKSYYSRKQGSASVDWDCVGFIEFINSLSASRYKFGVVYCGVFPENPEITASNVEKIILDFYEKTGKRPFMTDLDKPISSSIGHVVNISKIYSKQDEKWLVYEDPISGTQSERKLKDWCENCVKFHAKSSVKIVYEPEVSLTMFSIAKPECELYDYTIFSAKDQNNKENVKIKEWECFVRTW